ncbi:MAG: M42 family metallopeptidase [Paraclostridium sp.]
MSLDHKFLEAVTQVHGISGHEDEIRSLMYENLKDHCDEVSFDSLGSVIFTKGKGKSPRVMIAAHMDQIGFLICNIDDNGYCYIKPIGGWYPTQLLNQEVSVTTEEGKKYIGVIGHKPTKILRDKKEIEWNDIYIDFGVSSKEELLSFGIEVGNPVTPISSYKPLCNEKFVATKAWDDRVGCAIIYEVLKALKDEELDCELNLVGTVQEEVGLRGAKTASYKVKPDIGISIDIGGCGDIPGMNSYDCTIELGKGPSIAVLDAAAIGNTKLRSFAKKVADENSIPHQTDVMLMGGTDTGAMHVNQEGALGLTVSIPTRYGHSHNSIVHLDDVENAAKLLLEMVKKFNVETLEELKRFV